MNSYKKFKIKSDVLDPVCEVINICQNKNCSIAEAAHHWIELALPPQYKDNTTIQTALNERKVMALDVYSLAAYYLHPKYHMGAAEKIGSDFDIVQDFVIDNLDSKGIESWSTFVNKEGIFNTLFSKKVVDPTTFWTVAAAKHPSLSKLALKLLRIPASTAQLERMFSHWQHVHAAIRNRLCFEKSKKLTTIYYTLRSTDNSSDSEESE